MSRIIRILTILALVFGMAPAALPAAAQAELSLDEVLCAQTGGVYTTDADGAHICSWVPVRWNRDLVIFAHGYVDARMPVGIPWDQLALPDGASLPGMINALGYAFAVTSYSKNGLAVQQGVQGVFNLADVFKAARPLTRRVFLVGASEGGLVTTLALEKDALNPLPVFSGGVTTCGPVGDFTRQVNYWGDFRLLFDHYFPGVIPVPPTVTNPVINIDPLAIAAWSTLQPQPLPALPGPLQAGVIAALQARPDLAQKLIAVSGAPVDPADPVQTTGATTLGILGYNLTSTNEGRQELSGDPLVDLNSNLGSPYDNVGRVYQDPDGTPLLLSIYGADPNAIAAILQGYTTTGRIKAPLVGLHTLGDPIVPYWHELLYRVKTLQAHTALRFTNIPINRYGHCNFKAGEAIFAFVVMVFRATSRLPLSAELDAALPEAAQLDYQALLEANRQLLETKVFIPMMQR
jgi:hypothetical protein